MNKLKCSLKFSKYIVIIFFILIFVSPIFAIRINSKINSSDSINVSPIDNLSVYPEFRPQEFNIKLINNLTLVNYDMDGNKRMLESSRTYLYEREEIFFDALVTVPSGIKSLARTDDEMRWKQVFVTINNATETYCNEGNIRSNTKQIFHCVLTIETPDSMYGLSKIDVKAKTIQGNESFLFIGEWFLNPVIALGIDGEISLEGPVGDRVYSEMLLITNDADRNSGVILNMSLSGKDLYDPNSKGVRCPTSNALKLENIAYYASSGQYNTKDDLRADEDGYIPLSYREQPIMYNEGNILSQYEELRIRFRIDIPSECNGEFREGGIYIWGMEPYNAESRLVGVGIGTPVKVNIKNSFRINVISDITLLDDYIEGNREPLYSRSYLSEGEKVVFDTQVYHPEGIDQIADMYVTFNDNIGVNCVRSETIDDKHQNYHCDFTTESSDSMYEEGHIRAETKDNEGNIVNSYIGYWFFNPKLPLESHSELLLTFLTMGNVHWSN